MPILNYTKLFKKPDGTTVQFVRVSTLANYWYCAVRARAEAMGIETPISEALSIGKQIHDEITSSRKPSVWEKELEDYLRQFMVPCDAGKSTTGIRGTEFKVFMREWLANNVVIGHIVTHGVDDFRCSPEKEVVIVEYKTTNQRYIDNYKIAPALFQVKLYMWILEPLLLKGGYTMKKGELVYLNRNGEPLGVKDIYDYSAETVEKDITKILWQFDHPEDLIPPARFKCFNCPDIFKKECPFIEKETKP